MTPEQARWGRDEHHGTLAIVIEDGSDKSRRRTIFPGKGGRSFTAMPRSARLANIMRKSRLRTWRVASRDTCPMVEPIAADPWRFHRISFAYGNEQEKSKKALNHIKVSHGTGAIFTLRSVLPPHASKKQMKPSLPKTAPVPRLDRWVAFIVGVASVLAPLPLGATAYWSRFALEIAMTVAVTVWACGSRRPRAWLLLPVAAWAVAMLQIVPLPDRPLLSVAPVSAGAWKVARAGLADAWGTISIDPGATAASARRMLLATATMLCVADVAACPRIRRFLTGSLAVCGVLALTLGIAFPVSFNERILMGFIDLKGPIHFWKTPLEPPLRSTGVAEQEWVIAGQSRFAVDESIVGDGFGSFISSNQFANALCLTVPIAIAWAAAQGSRFLTPGVTAAVAAAAMAGSIWVAGGMADSRAGSVSLLLAGLVLAGLSSSGLWLRRIAWCCAGSAGIVLLVAAFSLYGPLTFPVAWLPETLQPTAERILADPRVTAAQVAFRMFAASPLLGTGLGTYGDLYQRFTGHAHVLYFAHNDYAQLLAETGLVGAVIAAAGIWIMASRFLLFCKMPPAVNRLPDAGAWAALAGLAAHSAFDWNMHVPANAFLATVVAGVAYGSVTGPPRATSATPRGAVARQGPTLLFVGGCLVAILFLARDAVSEKAQIELRKAITADRIATLKPGTESAEPTLTAAVERGERVARFDQSNAHLAVLMGQANALLATKPQPIDEADERLAAAARWFRRAQRRCAACRGLPEPVVARIPR